MTTLILMVTLAMTLVACGQSQQQAEEIKKRDAQIDQLKQQVAKLETDNKQLKDKSAIKVTLYYIKSLPTEFVLVPEERTVAPAQGTQLMESALNELIAGPATQGLTAVLPKGTRVLSVKVDKDLATVDLSKEATTLNIGSSGEGLVIAAIANTVTRIGTADRVQILIEGKVVETLAGHVSLDKPFRRNDTVVRHQ